jgi:hypothetical protein
VTVVPDCDAVPVEYVVPVLDAKYANACTPVVPLNVFAPAMICVPPVITNDDDTPTSGIVYVSDDTGAGELNTMNVPDPSVSWFDVAVSVSDANVGVAPV